MHQYLALGNDILTNGNQRGDRTGTGTISVFGRQVCYDLTGNRLPLLTTKKMFTRGMLKENLWTLAGDTDNTTLTDDNVNIWSEWAVKQENLEYSLQERALLALKQISAQDLDADMEQDLRRVAHNNDVTDDLRKNVLAIFAGYEIPALRPNPLGVKVGALGPVYGEQWRFWPSNDMIAIPLTLDERLQAGYAEGVATAKHVLDFVKRRITEPMDEADENVIHSTLDKAGVPSHCHEHGTIDQFVKVIEDLKVRPNSRRIIVSAWNPAVMPDETVSPEQNVLNGKAALASCHTLFQFYVEERKWEEILADIKAKGLLDAYTDFFNYSHGQLVETGAEFVKSYKNRQWTSELKGLTKLCREWCKEHDVLVDKLSCQLYQRSH